MLLLDDGALEARRRAAAGGLAPLAGSLAADLERLTSRPPLALPDRKAKLTRDGGRCPVHGTPLAFDPWSPRAHRCDACGIDYAGEPHDLWWIMGCQLWTAERAVHAALLHLVRGDGRHAALADRVLGLCADAYLNYPNRDNVLGPSRPFFSTYLESIWLLQLCVALDLREHAAPGARIDGALGARVRDAVIAPSAALIAGFDEGLSNRQVWNNAALMAAALVTGRPRDAEECVRASGGLVRHLERALLRDGTWYEGENYHLFAHRGLWYAVTMAERAGFVLPPDLVSRFGEGFAAPFLTALPDVTFPARRDSQFGVSLRQWRFAELAELGLARGDDPRLTSALAGLYRDVPALRGRSTGRALSTAEAERNVPPAALSRADLGWRSLLCARETLPELEAAPARSVLMAAQGLGIFRRDEGRLFVALDYGHSGGGHGHPDRLNLLLADGDARWLDDMGTGSYVDPSLHWYRSTLAHNAPLLNGASQRRVDGRLVAWDERGGAGWIQAKADGIAPGAKCTRALIVMPEYVIDELAWLAGDDAWIDLPLHIDGEVAGDPDWIVGTPPGGTGLEDGFDAIADARAMTVPGGAAVRLTARSATPGAPAMGVWLFAGAGAELWRATAPGPPGSGRVPFCFVRRRGGLGTMALVWDPRGVVRDASRNDAGLTITLADGAHHVHARSESGWSVSLFAGGGKSSIDLGGLGGGAGKGADGYREAGSIPVPARAPLTIPRHHAHREDGSWRQRMAQAVAAARGEGGPLTFELGEREYRRSEPSWKEAGSPRATVALFATAEALVIDVDVETSSPCFSPARDRNPLDNEPADINSDGVQLHLRTPDGRVCGWLLVPEPPGQTVRAHRVAGSAADVALIAAWSATPDGWMMRCRVPLAPLHVAPGATLWLDCLVNLLGAGRERRMGQLVMSGAAGEFVYLRGDRQDPSAYLPFVLADG